jgi:hypothetical protein
MKMLYSSAVLLIVQAILEAVWCLVNGLLRLDGLCLNFRWFLGNDHAYIARWQDDGSGGTRRRGSGETITIGGLIPSQQG